MKWRGFLAQKFYGVSPTTAGSSVSTTKPADDVIDASPFRAKRENEHEHENENGPGML